MTDEQCQRLIAIMFLIGAATNAPGARLGGASWTDKSGNLWLFGGTYIDGTSVPASSVYFNDVWEWVQSTD